MTRTGAALSVVKDEAKTLGQKVRMKTIVCGLKKAVVEQKWEDIFRDYSINIGICKRFVSLIANEILLQSFEEMQPIKDWFLWYTQVWSAVDVCMGQKGLKKDNAMIPIVTQILKRHSSLKLKECYHPGTVIMRQPECTTLATSALQHFELFPSRLDRYYRVLGTEILWNANIKVSEVAKCAKAMTNHTLKEQFEFQELQSVLKKQLKNVDASNALTKLVQTERELHGEWAGKLTPETKKEKKEVAFFLIPHLIRFSQKMCEIREQEFGKFSKTEESQMDCLETSVEEEDDCLENDDEDEKCMMCAIQTGKWSKTNKPRPFTILPVTKFRPSMVSFTYTEIKEVWGDIFAVEKDIFKQNQDLKKQKKRKRQSLDTGNLLQEEKCEEGPTRFEPDRKDFTKGILKPIEELPIKLKDKGCQWVLTNFRTNGIQLSLTFASCIPGAPNIPELVAKGYYHISLANHLDPCTTKNGLYRLKQKEGSLDCSNQEFEVVAIDPGLCKPVQLGRVRANVPFQDSEQLIEKTSFEHITDKEWIRHSGREAFSNYETIRRNTNSEYAEALSKFSNACKKTTDKDLFKSYVDVCIETCSKMKEELCHRGRSLKQWLARRRLQSFLSSVATRILQIGPSRKRQKDEEISKLLSENEHQKLKARIKQRRKELKDNTAIPRCAFFGDGTFSHMKGKAPMPKKNILHELAVRAPTFLIDEYHTSKFCPCGLELCTEKGSQRVRLHKDDEGDCNFLCSGNRDRDQLAAINIAMASLSRISNASWPLHLSRSSDD